VLDLFTAARPVVGMLHVPALPGSPSRGLLFEFAARGVPVVHLLYVKGLARENGLPFDPVPFPPLTDAKGQKP
jgi:poly-gamma-glutamate system protein